MLHEIHHDQSFPIPENNCHQLSGRQTFVLNFFSLFDEWICTHSFDCSLVSSFTNVTKVSSPVTHTMWLRTSLPPLWDCSEKAEAKAIVCICAYP
jgi:hypothetical protein